METAPKRKGRHIFIKLIVLLIIIFFILSAVSFPLKTVTYEIFTDKITEPVRIAQVSDLHSEYYGRDMKTLLEAIDEQSPDVIVLTGDIFDDVADNENTRIFLKAAAAKYPCYYVSGNHEQRKGGWKAFRQEAADMGVTVLEGENVSFMGITICGASSTGDSRLTFDESVEKCAEEAGNGFNVLLAHYPEENEYYRSFGKFDLVLSGHAHGGQWRVPYLINGVFAPDQGLFPEYAGGMYEFEDSCMIVSRGLSRTRNIIPRIFNNPELVIIDIMTESEEPN
ncbi:metallophosphoesterase [Huintestinicola sp.]|uniref:metallophosphoesterase n=1 Tax=Huintestinicola sp. TaxID=2981661 RepID=UPI003D7E2D4E